MLLSEFITRLQKLLDEHGDRQVFIDRDYFYDDLDGEENYPPYYPLEDNDNPEEYIL